MAISALQHCSAAALPGLELTEESCEIPGYLLLSAHCTTTNYKQIKHTSEIQLVSVNAPLHSPVTYTATNDWIL